MVVNFHEAWLTTSLTARSILSLQSKGYPEQFKGVTVLLGVGHDVRGLLRGLERDLVRSAPMVQLGLALLGLGHDGVDAGIVFELLETIQIVRVNDVSTMPGPTRGSSRCSVTFDSWAVKCMPLLLLAEKGAFFL